MLRRGLAGVPAQVLATLAETRAVPRIRTDAGYFTGDLARVAVEEGCDFAIAAKRNTARDDGDASSAGQSSWGYELVGMTERSTLLGGTLEAGPSPDSGWTVNAVLLDTVRAYWRRARSR
jgi:hypothetical protein